MQSAQYTVYANIASPDYKRPCVHRSSKKCSSLVEVYSFILDNLDTVFHWFRDDFEFYSTSVSEKALDDIKNFLEEDDKTSAEKQILKWGPIFMKYANDGEFNAIVYSDCYMNEPSYEFIIEMKDVLCISWYDTETQPASIGFRSFSNFHLDNVRKEIDEFYNKLGSTKRMDIVRFPESTTTSELSDEEEEVISQKKRKIVK